MPYGNIYKLWGLDKLHHVDLGVAKRVGLDRLKVSSPLANVYLLQLTSDPLLTGSGNISTPAGV